MLKLGYKLSSEEFAPNDLVRNAVLAEEHGFEFALISDHFHPWTDAQGQSPLVWSVIGALAHATSRLVVGTGVTCPTMRVHPTLVPTRRLIANVEGVMNAILVKGDAVGATLYYGAGAGAYPTASAVVADLVDVTRLITADPEHRVPHLAFQPDQLSDTPVLAIQDVETSYYLRMRVLDRPGVLADITRVLADCKISIVAMVQKEPGEGESQVDIVMLTHRALEKNVEQATARIERLDTVTGNIVRLRMEELL